jgi:hypothetical protein
MSMSKFIPIVLLALLAACAAAPPAAVPDATNLHTYVDPTHTHRLFAQLDAVAGGGPTVGYPPQTIGSPVPGHCAQWGEPIPGEGATLVDSGGPCPTLCLQLDSEQTPYWAVCTPSGIPSSALITTVAQLPVCNSSNNNALAFVTDSMPIITIGQAVVGGGSTWMSVRCYGATSTWYYGPG